MRYLCGGSGPALVLVHGLLGYSFSWRHALPVLSERATVYAVDMLGVGFSDRPPNLNCCFRAHAERLLRFLDSVGVTSCDLLGTSHGGRGGHDGGGSGAGAGAKPDSGCAGEPVVRHTESSGPLS